MPFQVRRDYNKCIERPKPSVYRDFNTFEVVEDTNQNADRMSAAAVLQFAAREAREGRRFAEFGAHAFASITYNAYGISFIIRALAIYKDS